MKKTLLFLSASLLIINMSIAQEAGLIRAGGGLAFGTESGIDDNLDSKIGIGLTVTGDYFFTDKIAVSPAFTYFFKSKVGDPSTFEIGISASTLDVDGKYFFLTDAVNVYGLVGLTIAFVKAETTLDIGLGPQTTSASDSEFGVNFGAGVDFYLSDTMFLNGQLKYNTPLEQLAIDLGIGFNF